MNPRAHCQQFHGDAHVWSVILEPHAGQITVLAYDPQRERFVSDRVFRIPLDQTTGELPLILFWRDERVPQHVKFAVELLHSENRRGCLQATRPVVYRNGVRQTDWQDRTPAEIEPSGAPS